MITLNVVRETIIASINNENFTVPYTKEKYEEALALYEAGQDCKTMDELKAVCEKLKEVFKVDLAAAESINEHLIYDANTRTYHLSVSGVKHPVPMPKKLADDLVEAHDKGLPTDPIVKFWTRLLRNPNIHKNDPDNVSGWTNSVVEYVTRIFVSPVLKEAFLEQGFSEEVAIEMATVRQTPFTMEGLVSTKKVVRPLHEMSKHKYQLDADGNAKKILRDTVTREIDEDTGKITDSIKYSEDWVFEPAIQGKSGDAFHCGKNSTAGHVIRVGQEMFLDSWDKVNCNFHATCVKGLHTGNQDYINGYESESTVTLNCFVDPSEIGAVAAGDDVLRVRELFPHSVKDRETDNRNLYHSSTYAAKKDEEWAEIRRELAAAYKEKQEAYMKSLEAKANLVSGI